MQNYKIQYNHVVINRAKGYINHATKKNLFKTFSYALLLKLISLFIYPIIRIISH